jgi:hypothetical protein
MAEHPILFSTDMVRAILDGRKTQTRRVLKGHYPEPGSGPYGCTGDRLWVRETWTRTDKGKIIYKADGNQGHPLAYLTAEWHPSIHMFREDSRLNLEIVRIGWDWLHNITEADAVAEGAPLGRVLGEGRLGMKSYREGFIDLWDSINFKRGFGWERNPKVWVIWFKVV